MKEEQLLKEFHSLGIEDLEGVTQLHELKGNFINLKFKLPSGQIVQFWNDDNIYYGAEVCKKNSDRCYGLAAGDSHLLVCEYGAGGLDAEIVIFKRR